MKRCYLCNCEVFADEGGTRCQDCMGVLANIHDAHYGSGHTPIVLDLDRERRIVGHMQRVEREEAEWQRRRDGRRLALVLAVAR